MARLSRHARLLYLLALFQLVGGPLMLAGVMFFVRLAADRQVTLTQQVTRAMEIVQGLEQPDQVWSHADGVPAPAKAPVPVPAKTKEGKLKLMGIAEIFGDSIVTPCALELPLSCWHDPAPIRQAQAPPLPPPREV